jgi:hypothetical protein
MCAGGPARWNLGSLLCLVSPCARGTSSTCPLKPRVSSLSFLRAREPFSEIRRRSFASRCPNLCRAAAPARSFALGKCLRLHVFLFLHFGFVVDRCFTEPLPSIRIDNCYFFLAFEGLLFFLGKDSLKFCLALDLLLLLRLFFSRWEAWISVSQLGGEVFTAGVLKPFLLG